MACMFASLDLSNIEDILNWNFCDLDKEIKEEERFKLNFEPGQNEEPISSDLFVVLEGQFLLKLAYETLMTKDVEKICTIPGSDFGAKNQTSVLFKYKNSNILIAALNVDPHHSAEVTELLRPYAELAKNVITLHTKSTVEYQRVGGGDTHDVTFVKGINSKFSHIKELQAPNMVSGIGAGVASWRAFKQLPVSSYIFFVRHIRIDNDSAKKVIQLLREIGLKDMLEYTPKKYDSSLFI